MKTLMILAVTLSASIGLTACSQQAQEQSAQAGNAIAADVRATTSNAADRIDASTSNAGDRIEAGADHVADQASDHLSNAGKGIEASADVLPGNHAIGRLARQMETSDAAKPFYRGSDHWRAA